MRASAGTSPLAAISALRARGLSNQRIAELILRADGDDDDDDHDDDEPKKPLAKPRKAAKGKVKSKPAKVKETKVAKGNKRKKKGVYPGALHGLTVDDHVHIGPIAALSEHDRVAVRAGFLSAQHMEKHRGAVMRAKPKAPIPASLKSAEQKILENFGHSEDAAASLSLGDVERERGKAKRLALSGSGAPLSRHIFRSRNEDKVGVFGGGDAA